MIAPTGLTTGFRNSLACSGGWVQEARGRWQFHKVSPGTCRVEWTYGFYPKNAVAAGILRLLVKRVWRGVMTAALAQIAEDIAAGKHRTS